LKRFNSLKKIIRHSVILFVVSSLLVSGGLPHFNTEDATCDKRIDLSDVIVWMKAFLKTADKPEIFAQTAGNVISAFHIAAGLKTVIKKDMPSSNVMKGLDQPFLILSYIIPMNLSLLSDAVSEKRFSYLSTVILPESPPS